MGRWSFELCQRFKDHQKQADAIACAGGFQLGLRVWATGLRRKALDLWSVDEKSEHHRS